MIVVRDIFQLKFGKARDALKLFEDLRDVAKRTGFDLGEQRVLTDLTGPYYTLVMESTYPSLADYERELKSGLGTDEWRKWYKDMVPLVDSGRREIFTIVQ